MKLTPSKCYLLRREVKYIGLCVSKEGIRITYGRIEAVKAIQAPKTCKEVCRQSLSLKYQLLEKERRRKFVWTEECEESLEDMKEEISKGITLCIPDIEDPLDSYEVTIDACNKGSGAGTRVDSDGEGGKQTVGVQLEGGT